MNPIAKARRYITKYGSVSGAADKLGIPRSSLRRMLESAATKGPKTAPRIAPAKEVPTGQWMQSLHHESAHFITEGLTACSSGENGAKIDAGMRWFPWGGTLRKCTRCMHYVEGSES